MTFVRRNVWTLPRGDETLLWYSKAIEELQSRKYSDATSWWSLAAMHGIDEDVWQAFGFIGDGVKLPTGRKVETLWNQYQHQTWYFLPWHRGYLNLPEGVDPAEDVEHLAGSFAMFGVSNLSDASASSGDGVSASFDITKIIDKVQAGSGLSDQISVKIITAVPGATSNEISVGRISLYRQEQ
ncbi:tyrosinase family protein (plasmid) [Rhizobium leguminosarum bv. trifolii]|uniref:DUF7868 domain-containing protein n=1 Tax=Rhizobium leguminosarum TaxID=384 RepID=UPI00140FC539|nr:tyrosinase family protein [Rhizobium leguminosarum]QIO54596.1 tyrosinase family protein [Rhizobium leguminosarum bv. trifolii]